MSETSTTTTVGDLTGLVPSWRERAGDAPLPDSHASLLTIGTDAARTPYAWASTTWPRPGVGVDEDLAMNLPHALVHRVSPAADRP